jgi:hypothetical protein
MSTGKREFSLPAESGPEDCSMEDQQYRLHVLEKVRRGTERAATEGAVSQAQAEIRLGKWLAK